MRKVIYFLFLLVSLVNAQEKEELIVKSSKVVDLYTATKIEYDQSKKTNRIDISDFNIKIYETEGANFFVLKGIDHIISTGGFRNISLKTNNTSSLEYFYDFCWVGNEFQGSCIIKWFEKGNIYVFITEKSIWQFTLGETNKEKTETYKFPEPLGVVSDFENVFSIEEVKELKKLISVFNEITSNQIAVVSIDSIGHYTDFDKYSLDLSNEWGVGLSERDNGLTIVFSEKLRKIRISSGTGTEKILTDEFLKGVIEQVIIPEIKKGNYYLGVRQGLLEIMKEWI